MKPLSVALLALLLPAAALAQDAELPPVLAPAASGPAQRIWGDEAWPDVCVRRAFEVRGAAKGGRLVFSCDNECTVFLDGVPLASADAWEVVTVVEVEQLAPGDHVVAIAARNTGGPAALACWLTWTDADGAHEVVTDAGWRVAAAAPDDWQAVGFDDTQWAAATANFTSIYGLNLYNGKPVRIAVHNRFSKVADAIEKAMQDLRAARDRAAALRALDAVDRAMVAARAQVWDEMPAESPARASAPKRPTAKQVEQKQPDTRR